MDKLSEDMSLERESKLATIAYDLMVDILADLDRSVDKRMFSIITSGKEISAETQAAAWGEKNAYDRIKRRLQQKIKLGAAASERLKPKMEIA